MDKKKAGSENCLPERERIGSDVGLGLAETLHAIARLPEAAFPEQVDTLEAFQDVAFDDETRDALQAFVL
jgi:hypothetical protein